MTDILIAAGLLIFAVISPALLIIVIMSIKNLQEYLQENKTNE